MDLFTDDETAVRANALDPSHREQPISPSEGREFAEWQWQLMANKVGAWRLRLRAYGVTRQQPSPVKEVQVLHQEDDLAVEFNLFTAVEGFWAVNWQWLWTTLLVPITGASWTLWRGRADRRKVLVQKRAPQHDKRRHSRNTRRNRTKG
jgi:hypothetical protein